MISAFIRHRFSLPNLSSRALRATSQLKIQSGLATAAPSAATLTPPPSSPGPTKSTYRSFSTPGSSTQIIWSSNDASVKSDSTTSNSKDENGKVLLRSDIAAILKAEHDLTTAQSGRILDTVFDTIVEAVSKSQTVQIHNFGKFHPVIAPARVFRTPQGGSVAKEETKKVKFSPYTHFKECVKSGGK